MTAPRDPTSTKTEPGEITIAPRRRSAPVAVIAIFVVAVVAVAAFLLFATGDEPADTTVEPTAPPVTTTTSGTGEPSATPPATAPPVTSRPQTTSTVDGAAPAAQVPLLIGTANFAVNLALDADGIPVFATLTADQDAVTLGRCLDAACSAVETTEVPILPRGGTLEDLALGPNGFPIIEVNQHGPDGPIPGVIRCLDPLCSESAAVYSEQGWTSAMAVDAGGSPVVVSAGFDGMHLVRCTDAACTDVVSAPLPLTGTHEGTAPIAVAVLDGKPVVAAIDAEGGMLVVVECADAACAEWSEHPRELPEALRGEAAWNAKGHYGADGRLGILGRSGRMRVVTCDEPLCSSMTAAYLSVATDAGPTGGTDITLRDDGSPVVVYTTADPGLQRWRVEVASCDDPTCVSGTISVVEPDHGAAGASIDLDGDLPVVGTLYQMENTAWVLRCTDRACEDGSAGVSRWDENTVVAREPVAPPATGWRAVDRHELGHVAGAVTLGGEFFVVASSCTEQTCTPQIGRSSDGTAWEWSEVELADAGSIQVSGAARLGDAAVVTGERCIGPESCSPVIWRTDFESWVPAEVEGCAEGCTGVIFDLVETPFGALAFGDVEGFMTLWFSTDGLAWDQASVEGYPDWQTWMTGAAAIGDGLVGVGETCPDWECAPAVWRSTDGASWARADATGLTFSQIDVLVGWTDHVTLLGGYCPPDQPFACWPAAWTTGDGTAWERHDFEGIPAGMLRAVESDQGLAMIISAYDPYWSVDVTVLGWTGDGLAWDLFELEPGSRVSAEVMWAEGNRVLVAGQQDDVITIWEWVP